LRLDEHIIAELLTDPICTCRSAWNHGTWAHEEPGQADAIVHRIAKTWFASQLTLCGLYRKVAKQELDLLQFASSLVAQFRAGSPKITRCHSKWSAMQKLATRSNGFRSARQLIGIEAMTQR